MKRILSVLLVIAMMLSLSAAALAEDTLEAPPAKEGETVVEFYCIMWESWNQNWLKTQVYNFNSRADRPFYVNLSLMDNDTFNQRIAAARAGDTAPDILCADYASVANFYRMGYTLDLKDMIPQSAWDDLLDSAKEFVTVGDAYAAFPWMMEPAVVMYYDKEAFTEVGLDPESPPTTWEELAEYSKMLTTPDRFGMDIDITYNMWSWTYTANNGYMLTDDWSAANINSQGMRDFAEFYRDIRSGEFASQTALKGQNVGVYAVLEERSAISFSGSWGVGAINNDYPEKIDRIGVAAAPTQDGSPFHATSGGWSFCVDAHAAHPQEAADFIFYMLGDGVENVADFFVAANFAKFTTRKSVADYLVANTDAGKDERIQIIQSDIMPYVVAEPTYSWDITQAVNNMLSAIALDGEEIDAAFATAEATINQYIADFSLAGNNPKAK
jgi:multiple sugar transport system substrate-binding protein